MNETESSIGKIISLQKIVDPRGNLSLAEAMKDIPFTVTLDDGCGKQSFLLNHPYQGLLVNTDIWRSLDDFSSGAVCLVLAEDPFDEGDYIRDYKEFLYYISIKKK